MAGAELNLPRHFYPTRPEDGKPEAAGNLGSSDDLVSTASS